MGFCNGYWNSELNIQTRAKVNRDSCSAKVYLPTTPLAISMALLHILC